METLSQAFLDSCRRDHGRILRGENMTRIETFVDAAFAFAFTMLVISIDFIPKSPTELLALSSDIPAFLLKPTAVKIPFRVAVIPGGLGGRLPEAGESQRQGDYKYAFHNDLL